MQGLLYGVRPDSWAPPDDTNRLLVGLSRVPMRLQELERPTRCFPRGLVRGQDPDDRHLRL